MKKVLALVLAVIMVCTMAFAVTITGNKTIVGSVSMDTELFCSLKRVFRGKKLTFAEKISEGGTWPRRHCGPTALPPESVPERSQAWHR